jgi:hypothetical protein
LRIGDGRREIDLLIELGHDVLGLILERHDGGWVVEKVVVVVVVGNATSSMGFVVEWDRWPSGRDLFDFLKAGGRLMDALY